MNTLLVVAVVVLIAHRMRTRARRRTSRKTRMENPRLLEHILHEIRETTQRHPDEDIPSFMARTWHLALLRMEHEKPALPLVEKQQETSAKRLEEEHEKDRLIAPVKPVKPESREEIVKQHEVFRAKRQNKERA